MKITKNQLRQIIKEEAIKLQKKTVLENRKKEIRRELRLMSENVTKEQIQQIIQKNNKDFDEVEDELWDNHELEIDVYDGHPSERGAFNIINSSGDVLISGQVENNEITSLNESFKDIFKSKATKEKEAQAKAEVEKSKKLNESVRKIVREGFLNLLKESAEIREDIYDDEYKKTTLQQIIGGQPYNTRRNVPLESQISKKALFLMSLLNKDSNLDFEKILKNNNVQFSSEEKYNILNDFLEEKDKNLRDEVGELYSWSDVDFLVDVRDKYKKEAKYGERWAERDLNESIKKIVREGFLNLLKESAETEELSVEQIFEDWLKKQSWLDFKKEGKDTYGKPIYGELNPEAFEKIFKEKGNKDEIDKAIENFVKEEFEKIFKEKGYNFHWNNLFFITDSYGGDSFELTFNFNLYKKNGDEFIDTIQGTFGYTEILNKQFDLNIRESIKKIVREGFFNLLKESAEIREDIYDDEYRELFNKIKQDLLTISWVNDGQVDMDHYNLFGRDDSEDLKNAIEWGEINSESVAGAIEWFLENRYEDMGVNVDASGSDKILVRISKDQDNGISFDINNEL